MNTETVYDRQRWTFPRVGQRIVKTSIAVFLCLVIYYLRGYEGGSMPTEAACSPMSATAGIMRSAA